MTMTDPIADFLTRIRNALIAQHQNVVIPTSTMKVRLAEILKSEGYISDFSVVEAEPQGAIHIDLKWIAPKKPAITKLKSRVHNITAALRVTAALKARLPAREGNGMHNGVNGHG